LIPPEVERQGLDEFDRIGEETSEVLERRPRSLVVVRVRRPKFVRKDRLRDAATEVLIAPPAELPIERGRAGPGLLADTIVRRWQDHIPFHRMEGIFARVPEADSGERHTRAAYRRPKSFSSARWRRRKPHPEDHDREALAIHGQVAPGDQEPPPEFRSGCRLRSGR
jgi:transposase